MNILMCADNFGGPTTTFIYNDFEYMSQKHNVSFLCIQRSASRHVKLTNIKQINYKRSFKQRVLSRFDLSLQYENKTYAEELNEFITAFKPKVIHCNFGKEALKIIDNLQDKTIPIVIQFRGYDASSALNSKSYVKRLQHIFKSERIHPIFVSESLRQNLITKGIPVPLYDILYSGINLNKFVFNENVEHPGNKKVFLQVSSLVEKKGHEYTLKAFSEFLKDKDKKKYKLILTGDGPRRKVLEILTKELEIEKNVDFIGYVQPDQAKELMNKADVFLHHSITSRSGDQEGIPNALMEAMAMKLPVLSTYHSGIPELIIDGQNGLLVDEKDIKNYAQKMEDIITWGKMENNRVVIETKFEMIIHNKKLESIYQKIL